MSIKTKLIILFIAFSIAPVIILGALSVKRAQDYAREATLTRLQGLADAKARLVETFSTEHLGDVQVARKAYVLQETMPVMDRGLDSQETPAFSEAQAQTSVQMTELKTAMNYNDVIVVNPAGRVLYAVNSNEPNKKPGDQYHDRDGKTLAQGRSGPYLSDVYVDREGSGNREMAIAAPVIGANGNLLGMVILEADVDRIFDIIGETTALGQTGEMVLVKREGDAVRFLTPRRSQPTAPLAETVAFRKTGALFPAQAAVTGESGSGLAEDYLGQPVLAAWRWLPALGWGLVVKINEDEVLAPARHQRDLVLLMAIGVILFGSLLAWTFGRSLTLPLVQLEQGAEIIGQGNLDHQIEHRGRDEVGRLAEAFNQMTQRLQTVTASRDELNAEIEVRQRAEAEAARAKRALFTLSQVNQALVRAQGEDELLPQVCRILVEDGGYRMSWIGFKINDPNKTVRPAAQAGFEQGYLETAAITWDENSPRGCGPTGACIRSRAPVVCHDFLTDPAFLPWREDAVKRGYASSFSAPLLDDGHVLGALMVYAAEPGAFNPEEVQLLTELSMDLAYGITFLRTRADLQRGVEDLRREVAERERAEALIQLRLRLRQMAETLSLDDFLQQTLDEIGDATGSPIGFYHFVEPDQRTLSLQAWSTRTLRDFCQAEGRGQHYDLDQAGVWADCLRERRPVVHNDYAALEHKRGLPPGHAVVVRELVAPIFRGDKVVAIFGVGNKPRNYTVEDVDIVKRFADIIWEIVERKRAEAAKEKAEQELVVQRALSIRADRLRSLGEMAAGIAHELNQPLAGVRGLAEHLLIGTERGWDLSGEKIVGKVRLIMGQADRMSHIIEHVRMFARGADELAPEPVMVNQVIEDGLSLLGAQLESRGVKVELELGQGLPPVLANPFSIEEVVVNLVNNARDALEDNLARGLQTEPAVIKVRTCRDAGPDGECIIIEVSDNGPGLPAEVQGKIFEPFFTTKRPDKGTGLGLAISRSIVEKFKGTIDLVPGPDRGAVATVSLPVYRPEENLKSGLRRDP